MSKEEIEELMNEISVYGQLCSLNMKAIYENHSAEEKKKTENDCIEQKQYINRRLLQLV